MVVDLIGLITVTYHGEKLQCLYENPMSNNFRKTAILKKNMNCKLKLHSKEFYYQILGAVIVLKFLQTLASDFPHTVEPR